MTRLWAGRSENRGSIPSLGKTFLFSLQVPEGTGFHPASYPMVTGHSFARNKATGT
jgi:hypothetical protein